MIFKMKSFHDANFVDRSYSAAAVCLPASTLFKQVEW